ncbi:MAG: dTDP-4-dehydrorhamnose 3,5-epimerase [Anaerorhabdus sp.]|uniref:dTDP-4-dehydrorhamnose 3,5-epimerase n=1 Tax=Anaerorhabdus sp. TaxID=1872524 RepID=UPI002FC8C4BD
MNTKWEFAETKIKGLYEITPFSSDDIRGNFTKDYSKDAFLNNGITHSLEETFYTRSFKGVIRAIHFQRVHQQPKLVRCIYGHVYDVVVDLRKDSPTFKQWIGFDLTGENSREILVPAGCGHGYLVLEDSVVSYKCSEKFYGEYDDGIMWNDKEINIDWPLNEIGGIENLIIAEKDLKLQAFIDFLGKEGG